MQPVVTSGWTELKIATEPTEGKQRALSASEQSAERGSRVLAPASPTSPTLDFRTMRVTDRVRDSE